MGKTNNDQQLPLDDPRDWGELPDDLQGIDAPLTVDQVLDRPLTIQGYVTFKSDFKKGVYYVIQAVLDGEVVSIRSGADRVCSQLAGAISFLPIKAVFRKQGRSYYLDKVD